jgi:hypothetical protein
VTGADHTTGGVPTAGITVQQWLAVEHNRLHAEQALSTLVMLRAEHTAQHAEHPDPTPCTWACAPPESIELVAAMSQASIQQTLIWAVVQMARAAGTIVEAVADPDADHREVLKQIFPLLTGVDWP